MNSIVTGGASGLGAAITGLLHDRGDHVTVIDRQAPAGNVEWAHADLSLPGEPRRAMRQARQVGGLHCLVVSAAMNRPAPFASQSAEEWDQTIAVNLIAAAAVVREALPELARVRGRVALIGSTEAYAPTEDYSAYCVSKAGLAMFAKCLALEADGRVGVTLVTPDGMDTPFFDQPGREGGWKPTKDDRRRLMHPESVAAAVISALDHRGHGDIREIVVRGTWSS
jgi:NAD(P)-dependent dehydrogenase (short-subunit alcohol dehydrogenase family)